MCLFERGELAMKKKGYSDKQSLNNRYCDKFSLLGSLKRCGLLISVLVLLGLVQGCTLDRTGGIGCPEDGAIFCDVDSVSYSFVGTENSYRFEGYCMLIENNEQFSPTGNPQIFFSVSGEWDSESKEFREIVSIEHSNHPIEGDGSTEWNLIGTSPLDPWLYPFIPTALKAFSGDPSAFAKGLCVEYIPPQFQKIPFSRNVTIHGLSSAQLEDMKNEAANPVASTPPPPPPPPPMTCTQEMLKAAPELIMPKNNLVYKENVSGVSVEVRSKCGAKHIDYQKSRYGVRFDHYESATGWNEYRTFKIPMKSYTESSSQGFETLPLGKNGFWRVKVASYMTLEQTSASTYSDWSDWVTFRIGPEDLAVFQIDIENFVQKRANQENMRQMKKRTRNDKTLQLGR